MGDDRAGLSGRRMGGAAGGAAGDAVHQLPDEAPDRGPLAFRSEEIRSAQTDNQKILPRPGRCAIAAFPFDADALHLPGLWGNPPL